MIELAYQHNPVSDIYYTIYKFDKHLFKQIERLIGLSHEHERLYYKHQVGVYKRTLIFILRNITKGLLENIIILIHTQGLSYSQMTWLITEIEELQLYCYEVILPDNMGEHHLESCLDQVNKYLDKCMDYYNVLHNHWKLVSLHKFKKVLLKELPSIMSPSDYNVYQKLLLTSSSDDQLEQAIMIGKRFVIDDWQHQLTGLDDYQEGNPFSFLVHTGYDKKVTQNFVSSTLITNNLWTTYHDCNVGFIMDPKDIVAAYARDIYTDNYALDIEHILPRMPIPTIHTKSHLEQECLQNLDTTGFAMSEIVTKGFKPLGIICLHPLEDEYEIKEPILEKQLLSLKAVFPNLPVIDINRQAYVKELIKK